MTNEFLLDKIDKEKLLQFCHFVSSNDDWKATLDRMVTFIREFFIFDNLVVYLGDSTIKRMDVLYARAMGRGRSKEADVSWGEDIASRVVAEKKAFIIQPENKTASDRLQSPFLLGVPLSISKEITGVLIFIRFGGPDFEPGSKEFAELMGTLFASVIRQKTINDYEKELSGLRRSSNLQDDFISTITHELRNPLGFIRGYTTTLLREDADWDEKTKHDFLEIIDRETGHLGELIDDLLDSSRLQSGNMRFDFQSLHIDAIIRDQVKRAEYTNPSQVIKLELEQQLPTVVGDPRRLAQVIDNLIENSKKYAPGSVITIKVFQKEANLVIEFSDTDPGIPEKYLPNMFSRFFRVPELEKSVYGTGLGLSICKQIINNHNGEISVSSSQGEGIKFTITLPLNHDVSL